MAHQLVLPRGRYWRLASDKSPSWTVLLGQSALADVVTCAAIPDRLARLLCFTTVPEIRGIVGHVSDGARWTSASG